MKGENKLTTNNNIILLKIIITSSLKNEEIYTMNLK